LRTGVSEVIPNQFYFAGVLALFDWAEEDGVALLLEDVAFLL
jgi:hypothetical protein